MIDMQNRILFVVGCPRSGTTLLQHQLCKMYGFRSLPETHYFSDMLPVLDLSAQEPCAIIKPHMLAKLSEVNQKFSRLDLPPITSESGFHVSEYFRQLLYCNIPSLKKNDIIVEKTPNHARFIHEISIAFPDALFLNIIRHPVDVVGSMMSVARVMVADGRLRKMPSLRMFINEWKNNVTTAFFQSWRPSVRHVQYESLVMNFESSVQQIVESFRLNTKPSAEGDVADVIADLDRHPWQASSLREPRDYKNNWQSRLSHKEAIRVENELKKEMLWLEYERYTSDRKISSKVRYYARKVLR